MFQKKGVGTITASPLVTAPPSNITRLYYNGSAAKSHSTTIVEYQNTQNKPSNIPKTILKIVKNTKIKKTTICFIHKMSRE